MAREKGILTPGLCIVADALSPHEAYELAHSRPGIQNIKVRPKSFVYAQPDESEKLRNGDFHVVCDGKFYFSRIDEIVDTLGLFARRGIVPDAVTYAPCVSERSLTELLKEIEDTNLAHTIVLTAYLPEQIEFTIDEHIEILKGRLDLADKLTKLGGKVAVYASAIDFMGVDMPEDVLYVGAGIRQRADDRTVTLEDSRFIGIDIPLIGSVMGSNANERIVYLDHVAPRA